MSIQTSPGELCRGASLTLDVRDAATGKRLACWVELTDAEGQVVDDWRVTEEWRGFPCCGQTAVSLAPGSLRLRIRFRLSHQEVRQTLALNENERMDLHLHALPWVPFEDWGYVAGESHNHISSEWTPAQASLYAHAFGLRYLNACQGWMQPADAALRPGGAAIAAQLEAGSTCGCHLHFGAERPKTRYGHVWWINLKPFDDPFGEYMSWHDSPYVALVERDASDPGDMQLACPLRNEPPLDTWHRYRRDGAACVAAHPTSWWLKRPDDAVIVTNISAELVFSLLCGEPPDALVVMGYDPDQIFYQNLWFHLLNEGYPVAGCGETDGTLRGKHHVGQINTYTRLREGEVYSPEALAGAVKAGRSVMSSGPFVRLRVEEGGYGEGDRIPATGKPRSLLIQAWSAPEPEEALTWLVLYRNGIPWKCRDLREHPVRHIEWREEVAETDYAWYAVKVYGRGGPESENDLDVLQYALRCGQECDTRYCDWKQVALTNPVFFVPEDWRPPSPVLSRVRLRLTDPASSPLPGRSVTVKRGDETLGAYTSDEAGEVSFQAPPSLRVEIGTPGGEVVSKSIFLDYRPVNKLLEDLYTGRWRASSPAMQPGQVPWSAFQLNALRHALEEVEWTLVL